MLHSPHYVRVLLLGIRASQHEDRVVVNPELLPCHVKAQVDGEHPCPELLLPGVGEPSQPWRHDLLWDHAAVDYVLVDVGQGIAAAHITVGCAYPADLAVIEQKALCPAVEPDRAAQLTEAVLKCHGELMRCERGNVCAFLHVGADHHGVVQERHSVHVDSQI